MKQLVSVRVKLIVLVAVALAGAAHANTSDEKLRLLMESARRQASASAAVGTAASLAPERLAERAALLKQGELDLANLRVDVAQQAFEKAALILHAADSEIALVRSYMQAGEYRRALAFGAHTAGAHLDVVGGTALYAWLLHIGGQEAVAKSLLDTTATRIPNNTVIKKVQQQLASGTLLASADLLELPLRLAPYSAPMKLPGQAQITASAVLLPGDYANAGRFALVPLTELIGKERPLWLRNGLGQISAANVEQRLPKLGVAVLRLATPLPLPEGLAIANSEAFPGSAAYAVQYPIALGKPSAAPAWPQLHIGFVGGMAAPANAASEDRLLGVSLPGVARGGPVFNAAGQWIGVAVQAGQKNADLLVTTEQLAKAFGGNASKFGIAPRRAPGANGVTAAPAAPAMSADRIYEASLKNTLQVIAAR